MVNLAPAHVQDAAGAELIVKTIRKRWPSLKHRFAEGAHDRDRLINAVAYHSFVIKVVCKLADQQDLQVLLRRWMVDRTFGWVTCWRRLIRDDERRGAVSRAMNHISICALLVRRIAHPRSFSNRILDDGQSRQAGLQSRHIAGRRAIRHLDGRRMPANRFARLRV